MYQPLIDAFDIATGNGWLELPSGYGERAFALAKGASHRYYKRIPKPGGGYRYFYKVGHGGTVANSDHFVEGAAFQHDGGHFHVKAVDGDKLTIEHDETGEKKTVTKSQLRGMLTERHGKELDAHRAKVHADLADARKAGASPKQIAKLEARAKAAGPAPKGKEKAESKDNPKMSQAIADAAVAKDREKQRAAAAKFEAKQKAASGQKQSGASVEEVLSEVPEYQRRAYRDDTAAELRAKAKSIRDATDRAKADRPPSPKMYTNPHQQKAADKDEERFAQGIKERTDNADFMERLADAKDRAAR